MGVRSRSRMGIRQYVPVADIDQTLREWEFQGGPPRADRWAGEHANAYAALRGALSALMWTPALWLSFRLDTPWVSWVPWVMGFLIVASGVGGFVLTRRATRHTETALERWDSRG